MAVTQNTYTGDGSTVLFSFAFPYLETTDVKVSLNGVDTTAYTFANATTIQFNTAPVNGAAIRIYRQTDDAALAATFYPGSAIRSQDLNDNFTQVLYSTQEVKARYLDRQSGAMESTYVPNTSTSVVTKGYMETNYGVIDEVGFTRWRQTASAAQTTFTGAGSYGGVLSYVPTKEQVYLNGALQQRDADYAANNGTSIVFNVALTAGDVVDVVCVNNLTASTVSDAANISYGGQFTGQSTRTVAAKLGDVVSVKDFSAAGDGARITQALSANSGMVYLPQDTYNLEINVTPTTGGLFIDPGATFDYYDRLKPRGSNSNIGNGVNVWRFQDRSFVGGAVSIAPTTTPNTDGYDVAGDPSGINSDYLERSTAFSSSSAYGGTGGLFAAKQSRQYSIYGYTPWASGQTVSIGAKRAYYEKLYTATTSGVTGGTPPSHTSGTASDGGVTWQFDSFTWMVPIGLASVADADISDGHSCWALYLEGLRRSTGGTLLTTEIAVKNKGSRVENNPYNILPGGATIGIWFAGGGDASLGAPANPSTAAIAIGRNATTWDRGIVFGSDSLSGNEAISMATGHYLGWYASNSALKASIASSVTSVHSGKSFLEFNDAGIWLSNGDALHCVIEGSTTDNSWLRIYGGTNSANINVGSAAANADLNLFAKGTGVVALNSPLKFIYSGFNLATTPANFTADRYMVVYDAAGVPFYIPARTAIW